MEEQQSCGGHELFRIPVDPPGDDAPGGGNQQTERDCLHCSSQSLNDDDQTHIGGVPRGVLQPEASTDCQRR